MSALEKRLQALCEDSLDALERDPAPLPERLIKIIRSAARLGAEHEREGCAELAESYQKADSATHETWELIVEAIRARGAK